MELKIHDMTTSNKYIADPLVYLLFSGDTYSNRETIKKLGFGYGTTASGDRQWQLLIQSSLLPEKMKLIRAIFPDIKIMKN